MNDDKPLEDRDDSQTTLVGFYESSADGPTLWIDIQLLEDLVALIAAIGEMMEGHCRGFCLHEKIQVRYLEVHTLLIALREGVGSRALETSHISGKPVFVWEASQEEWEGNLERLRLLIDSGGSGHHYMETPFAGGVTIELAFRERRPSTIT